MLKQVENLENELSSYFFKTFNTLKHIICAQETQIKKQQIKIKFLEEKFVILENDFEKQEIEKNKFKKECREAKEQLKSNEELNKTLKNLGEILKVKKTKKLETNSTAEKLKQTSTAEKLKQNSTAEKLKQNSIEIMKNLQPKVELQKQPEIEKIVKTIFPFKFESQSNSMAFTIQWDQFETRKDIGMRFGDLSKLEFQSTFDQLFNHKSPNFNLFSNPLNAIFLDKRIKKFRFVFNHGYNRDQNTNLKFSIDFKEKKEFMRFWYNFQSHEDVAILKKLEWKKDNKKKEVFVSKNSMPLKMTDPQMAYTKFMNLLFTRFEYIQKQINSTKFQKRGGCEWGMVFKRINHKLLIVKFYIVVHEGLPHINFCFKSIPKISTSSYHPETRDLLFDFYDS